VASERIYNGRVVNLRVDTVVVPGGRHFRREIVEHRGAVAIAAVDQDGMVLIVRQFRKPAGRHLLELPAGTLEPGEDPLRCARRELQEETGYQAQQWDKLAGFYTSPGFSTEFLHLYLARELQPGGPAYEADEQIDLVKLPLVEAIQRIESGEICDAKTVAGLLLARDQLSA
jgi:ADP-ribose pyrophosphatase